MWIVSQKDWYAGFFLHFIKKIYIINIMNDDVNLQETNIVFNEALKKEIKDPFIYQTIIQSEIQIVKINSQFVYFLIENDDARAIIKGYFYTVIEKVFMQFWKNKECVFISNIEEIKKNKETTILKNDIKGKSEKKELSSQNKKMQVSETNLIPNLIFENLLKVKYNEKAFDAIMHVLEKDDTNFSPLFISAPSGLGKTHLLNALGNSLFKKGKSVKYIDANTFTTNISSKFQKNNTEEINRIVEELSKIDVIMFDDIQNYQNKNATLNVIFNILNNHIINNRQIIITSDKTVNQLGGFEERFITRFASGLTIEMNSPSSEDIIDIWKFKLNKAGIDASNWEEESLKFISRNYYRSIRDLEGALKMIKFYVKDHTDVKYTYAVVKNIFSNVKYDKNNITPESIVKIVAKYYKMKPAEILGKSRKKEIVTARSIAIWVIKHQLDYKYKAIGDFFGGKDHTTIMNSIKSLTKKQKDDPSIKYALTAIEDNISKLD